MWVAIGVFWGGVVVVELEAVARGSNEQLQEVDRGHRFLHFQIKAQEMNPVSSRRRRVLA